MSDTRKTSFTLPNGATFSAEGTDDHIEKMLQRFEGLLDKTPTAATTTKPGVTVSSIGAATDDDGLPLDRLFSQDDYYGVALRAKPKTDTLEADGVLALLYGFATLKKETTVTAVRLQRAVIKSGLETARLGRTIAMHSAFVTESGKGKGKRYGLNNPGMTKAAEILRGILG